MLVCLFVGKHNLKIVGNNNSVSNLGIADLGMYGVQVLYKGGRLCLAVPCGSLLLKERLETETD